MMQSKSRAWVGDSADGCILAGPMFWAAMAAVASVYRAK